MLVLRPVLISVLALFLCAGGGLHAAPADADRPCQFWLWPGAKLPPGLTVERLYLLQGFFAARGKPACFIDQGQNARPLKNIRELVLVYRLDALQPPAKIVARFHSDAASWRQNGNNVAGLQLDFDAATGNIRQYNHFLQEIRKALAPEFQLSVTGLLDWLNAPPELTAASEVVWQTYQGKRSVARLERYLARLVRIQKTIPVDFKLGILPGVVLPAEIAASLSKNPRYQGQVIFLLPQNR